MNRLLTFPQGPFALRTGILWTMDQDRGQPLEDALILGVNGRVEAVGPWRELRSLVCGELIDLRDSAMAPGLVNAHTHLELSHLGQGLTLGQDFLPWVRSLVPRLREPLPTEALDAAVGQLRAGGTAFVADITSRAGAAVAQALEASGLGCWLFVEAFGFVLAENEASVWPDLPDGVLDHVAAAGHALYSTHPETLRRVKAWSSERGRPFSIHLAEHAGEVELLRTGSGELAEFYRRANILPADYEPPGCSPVAHADALGLLDSATVAVHCVQVDDHDLALLKARGATVCLCPRSNARMAVGRAPVEAMFDAGLTLCLGTDGLTSNADLDLWNELRFLRQHLDRPLGLGQALALVTLNPARALGAARDYGRIAPGGKAAFSIIPEDVAAWPMETDKP